MKIKLSGKTQKVYEYLKTHDGITSMESFELFGATRLSAIIFNLKKYGCEIKSNWKTGKDRYGNDCRFVKYELIGESSND